MSFSTPITWYHLLLLLPLIGIIAISIKYHKKTKKIIIGLRIASIILILLFLLGLQLNLNAKKTMTIFVADLSASTGYEVSEIEDFIVKVLETKKADDLVGIVSFGKDVQVQVSPSDNIHFNGFETNVNEHFTNIAGALLYADALFEPGYKKRIVLITDGYENMGEAVQYLKSVPDKEMLFTVKTLNDTEFPEVLVADVQLPREISNQQNMDVTVSVFSNIETDAVLVVYAGDTVSFTTEVTLSEGLNQYVYSDQVDKKGLVTYSVEVIPEEDTFVNNNKLSAFTKVTDQPYILMIYDDVSKGDYFETILGDSVNLDKMHTDNLVENLQNLISYDGFVLVDVSAENLSEAFMVSLQELVQYQGKGLLVTGGDHSYGPGGYFDTPLEAILPVDMTVEPKEETPNLGLVLVIDKSGSMTAGQFGVSKLELAKEAAIRGTEVLEDNDYLGVIAFDDTVKWVIETTLATDKAALQDTIATIVPGGGTTIKPSLQAAVDNLVDVDAKLKHIILLTDGQAEQYGYETILDQMEANDITISTVAVGRGSDIALLTELAEEGNGRFYLTDEFSNIPTIFAKEAFIAGEKYLNHITFNPMYQDYSEIMSGITAVPSLDGYVSTKMKNAAKLILKTPDDDPILATWQYGLGRTVAWTSDVDGLWSSSWLNHSAGSTMFKNIFGWMIQSDINRDFDVITSYEGGLASIRVEGDSLFDYSGDYIEGSILTPEGVVQELSLEAIKPGVYEGVFEPEGEGVYLFDAEIEMAGDKTLLSNGVMVGYSPEYDFTYQNGVSGSSANRLSAEKIALLSEGIILDVPKDVFENEPPQVLGLYDLSKICLWLAFLVFLSELILRKTNLLNKTATVINESKMKLENHRKDNEHKVQDQSNQAMTASDLLKRKQSRKR